MRFAKITDKERTILANKTRETVEAPKPSVRNGLPDPDHEKDAKQVKWPVKKKEAERAAGGRVEASNIDHAPSEAQKDASTWKSLLLLRSHKECRQKMQAVIGVDGPVLSVKSKDSEKSSS